MEFREIIFNTRRILVSSCGVLKYPYREYEGECGGARFMKKSEEKIISLVPSGYKGRYLGTVVRSDPSAGSRQKILLAHRAVAMAWILNPSGFDQVHHIDGNQKNNRVDNLEWVDNHTNSQEWTNRRPKKGFKEHKTKKGVIKYTSRMNIYGTSYSLGYFETKKEAQQCYRDTYKEWWGVEPYLEPRYID